MIWNQRKTILCRELIVGKAEMFHAKFGLDEVHKAECEVLGSIIRLLSFSLGHLYGVHIIVIAIDRPVDHILSVRSPSVCDHHLRSPQGLSCLHLCVLWIDSTVVVLGWVISLRHINGHVCIWTIILQHGHHGEVLNDVISRFRSNGLACF